MTDAEKLEAIRAFLDHAYNSTLSRCCESDNTLEVFIINHSANTINNLRHGIIALIDLNEEELDEHGKKLLGIYRQFAPGNKSDKLVKFPVIKRSVVEENNKEQKDKK